MNPKKPQNKIEMKPSRKERSLDRPQPTRYTKPNILIFCEGKNTEPSYFRHFKLQSATIKVDGDKGNTIGLVRKALKEIDQYDQVWCVFDKDDFSEKNFNDAISLAKSKGVKVAYSNQAFEYWLILHLEDHQGGGFDRSGYNHKINELLRPFGVEYEDKQKFVSDDFFDVLDGIDGATKVRRVDLAIRRAKKIYDAWNHQSPAREESSTTVFELVETLLKHC